MSEDTSSKKQLIADTFGRTADFYDASPFFHLLGRRLVDLAGVSEGSVVLDIATGRGAVLFPAAERAGPGGHVTGIDIAEPLARATDVDAKQSGLTNVDVRQMDAENLRFPDSSFDFVLCGFGIMLIPDLERALGEMRRVLKPGATLAVSTWASTGAIQQRYNELAEAYSLSPGGLMSQRLDSLERLESVLREAGFEDVRASAEVETVIPTTEEQWWSRRLACFTLASSGLGVESLNQLKRDTYSMLQEFKEADGIHDSRTANFAVASAPS